MISDLDHVKSKAYLEDVSKRYQKTQKWPGISQNHV